MEQEYGYTAEYVHDSGIRYVLAVSGTNDEDVIEQAYNMLVKDSVLRSVSKNGSVVYTEELL